MHLSKKRNALKLNKLDITHQAMRKYFSGENRLNKK